MQQARSVDNSPVYRGGVPVKTHTAERGGWYFALPPSLLCSLFSVAAARTRRRYLHWARRATTLGKFPLLLLLLFSSFLPPPPLLLPSPPLVAKAASLRVSPPTCRRRLLPSWPTPLVQLRSGARRLSHSGDGRRCWPSEDARAHSLPAVFCYK